MKKIQLKTYLSISIPLGIVALIIAFVISWNNPDGDTPEEIKKVETAIEREFGNAGSLKAKKIESFKIRALQEGFTQKEIDEFLSKQAKKEEDWDRMGRIIKSLKPANARIALAKALVYFKEKPFSDSEFLYGEDLWENRFKISKQDWEIQSFTSRTLISLGVAVISCVGSIIIVLLILTIIFWLWYFLLDRISELSQAIRGK